MLVPDGFISYAAASVRGLRGGFWHVDQTLVHGVGERKEWPGVVAIIPARNEGDVIGEVITSHMRLEIEVRAGCEV
jgi:hypothetical protein